MMGPILQPVDIMVNSTSSFIQYQFKDILCGEMEYSASPSA